MGDTAFKKIFDAPDWITRITPATDHNYFLKMEMSMPSRPVIGHTPEKRLRRLFWSRAARIGNRLNRWFGRFEYHDNSDGVEYDAPYEYWTKREWEWVVTAGERSRAAMPQPIYDPTWTPPARRTVEWGSRALIEMTSQ